MGSSGADVVIFGASFQRFRILLRKVLLACISICMLAHIGRSQAPTDDLLRAYIDSVLLINVYDQGRSETIEALENAMKLCDELGDLRRGAKTKLRLGDVYNRLGDADLALQYLKEGLVIFENLKDSASIANVMREMAVAHYVNEDFDPAVIDYLKAHQIAKTLGLTNEILLNKLGLGSVYFAQGQFDRAISMYREALAMQPKGTELYSLLGNVSLAFIRMGRPDSAMYYVDRNFGQCEGADSIYCKMIYWERKSDIFWVLNDFDSALYFSNRLIDHLETKELDGGLVVQYNRLAQIYAERGDHALALHFYEKSLNLAKKINFDGLHLIYFNVATAYVGLQNYEKAYDHILRHVQLRDSLDNVNRTNKFEQLLVRYETLQREQEVTLLQKENELKQVLLDGQRRAYENKELQDSLKVIENENRIQRLRSANELQFINLQREKSERLQREQEITLLQQEKQLQVLEVQRQSEIKRLIFFAALLIFIVAFVLVRTYRQKEKAAQLLAGRTEELSRQQTETLIQQYELKQIKARIEGQEKERKRIAQELHDGVAGSLAGIKLSLSRLSLSQFENTDLDQLKNNLDQTYNDVRAISANLSPIKIADKDFVQFLHDYLAELSQLHHFDLDFNESIEVDRLPLNASDKLEVYRILQEIMNNIVKHAKAIFVEVSMNLHGDIINIMVEDNGCGFDMAKVRKGMGLNNISARVAALSGVLDIDSMVGRGTIINIDIPVREEVTA